MNNNFFHILKTKYSINLNEQQQAAVVHKDGPCLILAVPGGGKTTTLLSRTAYLILEENIKPENILSITFSRASANDMKKRFEYIFAGELQKGGAGKVNFATIHSFSYRVVMSYYKSRGVKLRLIEGADAGKWSKVLLLKNLYLRFNKEYITDSDLDALVNDISYVKNSMYDKNEIKNYKSDIHFFMAIYEAYEKLKKENNCIDFDDMLVNCYDILNNYPQALGAYQKRFRYIQVDEAQDTSILQHKIIQLLAKEHKNIFYVADDDQSIYGFRAACPGYLLDMKEHYPEATIYRMEQNYRSTDSIVSICNQFIKENTKRYDKNIFTENDQGTSIEIAEVDNRFKQIDMIVKEIQGEDYENVALIYRNNQTAITIAKHFVDHKIPFYLREFKNRFFTHWAVKDILGILSFAQEQKDLESFTKFYYRLRGYYISKQMVDNCTSKDREETIFESLINHNALNEYQRENVEKLQRNFTLLSNKRPSEGIDYILDVMGYREFLMDRASSSDATYDTYMDMVIVLRNLSRDCGNLDEVIRNINDLKKVMKEAANNAGQDVVTLTTAHSSKGLEWEKVYLIDLQDGVFPNRDVSKSAREGNLEGLEEERRLFYVAMTRAKKQLKLLKIKDVSMSVFVEEVEELLDPEKKVKRLEEEKKIQGTYISKKSAVSMNRTGLKPAYWGVKSDKGNSITDEDKEVFESLKKGRKVKHKKFGEGEVVSKDKEHIVITFNDKERKLGLWYCLENNLLTVN